MSNYIKYRDSEIVWIGMIPDHWNIKRLKDLVLQKITDGPHETPELVDDEDGVPFISAEAITENGINYEARGGNISVEQDTIYSQKCKPKRNDIFIVKSGSTTGRIGYVDTDMNFNIWSPLALVRSNNQMSSRFLFHFLTSDCIQRQIQNTWSFGTQPNIGMGVIERLRLSIPPISEQLVIGKYLDDEIQIIDKLISNKKAQTKKLKELRQIEINNAITRGLNPNAELKQSDIVWLGKIPKHWKERRLKYISYMKGRIGWQGLKNEEFTFTESDPFLITGMNFKDGAIRWNEVYHIPEERFNEAPEIQLSNGDVLMTKDGTIGKLLYVDNIPYPHCASLNSHLLVFRPLHNSYYPRFLYFQLQSNLFQDHIEVTKTGTTFFGITQEAVGNYKVLLPDLAEQIEITNYLDKTTMKIEKLITNIDIQIEKLHELRRIIIYEAVTGKFKVSGYAKATT